MNEPKPDYAGRRHRVFERLGSDVLVLAAAPVRYKSGDTDYEYRPSSDLIYLGGIDDPRAVLVLVGHAETERTVLFLPEADPTTALWSGARTAPEAAAERYGVDAAYGLKALDEQLLTLLAPADRIFYRLGADPGLDRLVRAALEQGLRARRRTGRGPVGVLDSSLLVDELRLVKDAGELARVRAACALTIEGHRAGLASVAPDVGEWEVEARIEAAFRSGGGFGPAFATIVGSGANACVLHYTRNDRVMEGSELVLIDAGAELGFYSGDVTRTAPVSGVFTEEQRALYTVVNNARAMGVAAATPGASVDAPHVAALHTMVDGLIELGILTGTAEEAVETRAFSPYVPHKTSHWLGLDVHDVGDYVVNGEPRVLEPGMVLTVEPGLYLGADDEAVPEGLRGMGVRIEDDVLVTKSGPENLTAGLPTDPDALTELMAELNGTRGA